jgi:predicted transcriptional regulator
MLRRHLNAHGLTVEAYKAKWGLPADYPLVAADYAAKRSALAFSTGLGRKPEPESVPAPVVTARPFPKRRPKGAIKPSEDTFS